MKTPSFKRRMAGLTTTEAVVIIFVFIALFGILFLGAGSCPRGSDRSANILNIRNVQAAMRGHANLNHMKIGDALDSSLLVSSDGSTGYMKIPHAPAGLPPYTYRNDIPPLGTLYVTNHFNHPKLGFSSPGDYEDW